MKCALVFIVVSLAVSYSQAQLLYTTGTNAGLYGGLTGYRGYALPTTGYGTGYAVPATGLSTGYALPTTGYPAGYALPTTGYPAGYALPTTGYSVSTYSPGYTTGYTGYAPTYGVQYRAAPAVVPSTVATAAVPAVVGTAPSAAYPVATAAVNGGIGALGVGNVPIGASVPAYLTRLYGAGAGAGAAGASASKK